MQRKFPFVLMDRGVRGLDCDLVQGDNLAGARRLVRHLISIGHRRIAAIIEPDNVSTARERLEGYRDALKSAGIAFDPELVAETSGDRSGGYSATHQILSLHPLPTAILAINNMTALGAMQAVRERGLKVPTDIALVCFDDVEHLAVLSPFLTVMNQPAESFGTVAAQLLLDRIAGKAGDKRRQVVLQPHLLVRESCGAKAGLPSGGVGADRPAATLRSTRLAFAARRRAERGQRALGAVRLAREADPPPVPDELVPHPDPALVRQHLHQVLLDPLRVGGARQAEAHRQPLDVRVDDDPLGDPERRAEHDVGRLARHARQRGQLGDRPRHLAAEVRQQGRRRPLEALGLLPEEAGRADDLLQRRQRRRAIASGVG